MPICLRLLRQTMERAFSRAWAKTGKRMAARMAMIAITTSSSIKVKPRCFREMHIVRSSFAGGRPDGAALDAAGALALVGTSGEGSTNREWLSFAGLSD